MKQENETYFIYRLLFNNDKSYVGQTKDLFGRIRKVHMKHYLKEKNNSHLCRAIRKYGWKNIELKIVDIAHDRNEINELEKHYIEFYDSKNNGYNMTDGGDGFSGNHTESTKIKISETLKGKYLGEKHHFYGKRHTEETKKILALKSKGDLTPKNETIS